MPRSVGRALRPRAPKKRKVGQTNYLGVTHGQRLERGAQAAAGGANQAMATVGAVNRADERDS